MQRTTVIALVVVGGLVALAVVAWLFAGPGLRRAADQVVLSSPAAEKSFNESFEKSMREECISSAMTVAAQRGAKGPEVEAQMKRRCECAVEVARPLPISDKLALRTDREKLAKLTAEVIRRCSM